MSSSARTFKPLRVLVLAMCVWLLGGEIIRRRHDDRAKRPIEDLLFDLLEDEGGPLIWPRITESEQNAFDATCRKLYRFLNQAKPRS